VSQGRWVGRGPYLRKTDIAAKFIASYSHHLAEGCIEMERSMRTVIAAIFVLVVSIIGSNDAKAVPAFARKFGVWCAACHTTPPRLNETGYRFRAAGFRWPEGIGIKESAEHFDILDYMSARIQVSYSINRSKTGATEASISNGFKLQAFELYPFIGSWGKYFSTDTKVTFGPDGAPVIENAYVKVNEGDEKRFFEARLGIFHPYDGYGASDSPATISRPFFQTTPANHSGSTLFTTWGFDQLGAEVGFDYKRTSVKAALLNGLVLTQEDGKFKASAAQGGALTPRSPAPSSNTPDFQFFINQVLSPEGGGLSLQYYHGNLFLPVANSDTFFLNKFDRVAVYGSYPVAKRLHLLGGFQRGRDHLVTGEAFASEGAFVEAAVPVNELTAAGVRYDWFDPARDRVNNESKGITSYLNAWFYSQFRVVVEYQRKNIKRGSAPEQRDDAFQVRFIYIK